MELNKRTVSTEALGPFLLRYAGGEYVTDEHGESDQQVKILSNALEAAPGEVYGVSYDYLKEQRLSLASFLFCNVTLGGKDWSKCRQLVERHKVTGFENKSPQPTALDVVRLAKSMQSQRGCALNLTAADQTTGEANENVRQVAQQLPQRCGELEGYFRQAEEVWFSRTKAMRPSKSVEAICLLEDAWVTPKRLKHVGA